MIPLVCPFRLECTHPMACVVRGVYPGRVSAIVRAPCCIPNIVQMVRFSDYTPMSDGVQVVHTLYSKVPILSFTDSCHHLMPAFRHSYFLLFVIRNMEVYAPKKKSTILSFWDPLSIKSFTRCGVHTVPPSSTQHSLWSLLPHRNTP